MADTHFSRLREFSKILLPSPPVVIGFVIILFMILLAIFAPQIAPYDPIAQNLVETLKPPSAQHLLGTDALGRDLLSRIIYGSRISLTVGLVSTLIAGSIGMTLGLISGYFGGWVDNLIMRVMDAMMSIPLIIMALFLGGVLGRGLGNIVLSLGIVLIPGYARLTRGQVMSLKQLDFISAATIGGASRFSIAVKHILPNSLSPNLVLMTMNLGIAILVEAGLIFLGMGINPPTPSWGSMVSEGYRYLKSQPLFSLAPGLFVMVTVWAFNMVGDALRDALDPRLRGTL
jgi:ABC-type dipeptide/oligopeptide/nickel transport system permease subunit